MKHGCLHLDPAQLLHPPPPKESDNGVSNAITLESCSTRELVKVGGAATGLGPNVNTQCRSSL